MAVKELCQALIKNLFTYFSYKVNAPLAPPYTVPHSVNSWTIIIDLNSKKNTLSIDRVKPAYLLIEDINTNNSESQPSIEQSSTATSNSAKHITTRCDR
ncbi:hypothetical protein NPIL_433621, partial [Nephila pilipes]